MTAATDPFDSFRHTEDMSALNAYVPTKHDTNEIATVTRGVYVGGAGDLKVVMVGDSAAVTFVGVPAGTVLPIRVKQIYSTGTTATNLLALY